MADINDIVSKQAVQGILDANKALQETAKSLDSVIAENEKLKKQLDETAKATNDLSVKSTAYTQILNATEKEQQKINATAKQMAATQQQLITVEAKLSQVQSEENKALIAKQIALQKATAAEKEKLKVDQAEEGSLTRMRQKLSELTKEYDNSAVRTKKAAKEIADLSRNIQIAENETNRFQRGVGDYKQSFLSLSQGLATGQIGLKGFTMGLKSLKAGLLSMPIIGWIAAAVTALGLMGSALIKNAKEFGVASSSLKAITGASAEDMDFMKSKAKEYARESSLSATEVLGAFEKIGSAAPQLLRNKEALTEVTQAAITLSESTGGKLLLEDAAKATTAAMNQFGLSASDATKIVNTLAAGSQAGSAEVQDLTASFKNVGAVASSAGMSLEETVAALETLGEKGIYAEEAGTKLRGVILKLQAAGLGYASGTFNLSDALKEANGNLEKQGSAMEKDAYYAKVFGAENITAGKVMLDNVGKFEELTTAVTGTNAAYDMAKIQTDNLANSNKKFKNAWSSLMLSIEDGSGILSQIWKGFIDGMTAAFNGISKFIDKFKTKDQLERKAAKVAEKEREAEAKANEEMAKQQAEIDKEQAAESQKQAAERKQAAEEKRKQQEKGFKLAADIAEKGAELNKKTLEQQKKDEEDFAKWENDLVNSSFEDDKAAAEASTAFMIGEAEREHQRKVMLIKATSKTKEEAEEKIYQLDVQSAQASIDTMTNAMNSINATEEQKWQYKEKIAQAQMDLDTLVADHEIDNAEKVAEKKKKLQESIYEASMQVSGALFDFMDAKYSGELAKLEQKNEQGLLSDKEYATQKAEIEIKQAKASRARGIFDATINTATAIIKALADPGGIAGVILSVAAGVTGALQIASILSQPLPVMPAFAKGTFNAPETFRAGERGRELGLLKTGEAVIFEKDGIYSDPKYKGARILPNAETEAMFRNQTLAPQYRSSSMSDTRIVNELKSVKKAIVNSQRPIVDSRGEIIGTQIGNHREFNHSKRYTPWA